MRCDDSLFLNVLDSFPIAPIFHMFNNQRTHHHSGIIPWAPNGITHHTVVNGHKCIPRNLTRKHNPTVVWVELLLKRSSEAIDTELGNRLVGLL